MRYFKAFYTIAETDNIDFHALQALHVPFDDKAYALPYRCRSWSDENTENFAVSLIVKDGAAGMPTAKGYLEKSIALWKLGDARLMRLEESTVEDCFMDGVRFRYSSCCFDEDQIKRLLNLSTTCSFIGSNRYGLKESIVGKPLNQAKAISLARDTDYADSLAAELQRIFTPAARADGATSTFAPISYIVEGNAHSDAEEAIGILLGAMQSAGRLQSGHVFTINIDEYMRWPGYDRDTSYRTYLNPQMIRALEGNTIVIRYGMFDARTCYDVQAYRLLTMMLELIEGAASDTQVMLSVPEGNQDLIMRLRKKLNMPAIVLRKDKGTALSRTNFENNLAAMESMARRRGVEPDERMGKLLLKRMRGCSALELEDVLGEWLALHDARLAFPQYARIIDEAIDLDVPAEEASAQMRLDGLIGLSRVKEHIRTIVLRIQMNQRLIEKGLPTQPFSMHMAFLGSPGTGKTEVARLYAEILKDNGVLSEGRLVTVSGGSGFDVRNTFEAAKGSVLFIDEAYALAGFENTIAELIAQMENHRDDTVVILAGYTGHMNALFGCNPGFRSRIGSIIEFPDYTTDELRRIFAFMCAQRQMVMGPGVEEAVRDAVERGGRRADQGNARFVRKMFEDAVGAQQVRLAKRCEAGGEGGAGEAPAAGAGDPDGVEGAGGAGGPGGPGGANGAGELDGASGAGGSEGLDELSADDLRTLVVDDIAAATDIADVKAGAGKSARDELNGLVGLEAVKELISARMDFARMQKVKRDAGMKAPFIPMHMAFKGNPGTGKTEVARLVGRILREEGVLSVGDFFECGRQDLVSPIVGATAPKVEALFQEARGSVIFIDEAYSLLDGAHGSAGDEAITTIIDQMEKLRDEVVVIFAGYTKEIDDLLASNPGFASRIKAQLDFPDYRTDELMHILRHMADAQGYVLSSGVEERVRGIVEQAMRRDNFGNARFVRSLLEDALVAQSVRLVPSVDGDGSGAGDLRTEDLSVLLPEDFAWTPVSASSCRASCPIGFTA